MIFFPGKNKNKEKNCVSEMILCTLWSLSSRPQNSQSSLEIPIVLQPGSFPKYFLWCMSRCPNWRKWSCTLREKAQRNTWGTTVSNAYKIKVWRWKHIKQNKNYSKEVLRYSGYVNGKFIFRGCIRIISQILFFNMSSFWSMNGKKAPQT